MLHKVVERLRSLLSRRKLLGHKFDIIHLIDCASLCVHFAWDGGLSQHEYVVSQRFAIQSWLSSHGHKVDVEWCEHWVEATIERLHSNVQWYCSCIHQMAETGYTILLSKQCEFTMLPTAFFKHPCLANVSSFHVTMAASQASMHVEY